MRLAKVYSFSHHEGALDWIVIEVGISKGLNHLEMIGLSEEMKKSYKLRLQSYFRKHFGKFPRGQIYIHVDSLERKRSSYQGDFFLPMVLALYLAQNHQDLEKSFFAYGDLNIEEEWILSPTSHACFPEMLKKWRERNLDVYFFPKLRLPLSAKDLVEEEKHNLQIFSVKTNQVFLQHLRDIQHLEKEKESFDYILEEQVESKKSLKDRLLPLSILKNQSYALDALLLACAGFHSTLLVGSVGCGKTQLAFWSRELLPLSDRKEKMSALAYAEYMQEEQEEGLWLEKYKRPLFYLHPSTSVKLWKRFQEHQKIKLWRNSHIVVWDEIHFFEKKRLQWLFQKLDPLVQEGEELHIACANVCPCGCLLESESLCRCSRGKILQYQKNLTAALLNRFAIKVEMSQPKEIQELDLNEETQFLKILKQKILLAEQTRRARGQEKHNAFLTDRQILEDAYLSQTIKEHLDSLYGQLDLNARSFYQLLRLARTQADLLGDTEVEEEHLWLVLPYLSPQSNALIYWNTKASEQRREKQYAWANTSLL